MAVGDEEFATQFEHLRRRAYRCAYRLLGDRARAEDVAAETLARAYARWSAVQDHAEPWVVRVAANLAIDDVRRQRRGRGIELVEHPAPDAHVGLRLELQDAMRRLPRRQREVVALRFLGDFSEAETAEALGLTQGTVKSHASRGLAALRLTVDRV